MKKNKEGHQCTRNMKHTQVQKDEGSVVILSILRDSDVQLVSTNAEIVTNMVISVACATRKKHLTRKGLWSQYHPKYTNFRLVHFIYKIPYVASQQIYPQAKTLSACN